MLAASCLLAVIFQPHPSGPKSFVLGDRYEEILRPFVHAHLRCALWPQAQPTFGSKRTGMKAFSLDATEPSICGCRGACLSFKLRMSSNKSAVTLRCQASTSPLLTLVNSLCTWEYHYDPLKVSRSLPRNRPRDDSPRRAATVPREAGYRVLGSSL
jgi:hypothetical protein